VVIVKLLVLYCCVVIRVFKVLITFNIHNIRILLELGTHNVYIYIRVTKYQTRHYSFVLFSTSWIGYTLFRYVKPNTSNDDYIRERREKWQTLRHAGRYELQKRVIGGIGSLYTSIIIDDYEYTLFSTVISRVDDEYSFNAPGYHTVHNIFQL